MAASTYASQPAARSAMGLLLYTIGVILVGAFVRATLSGDGCGAHWPSCHGEAIPFSGSSKTLIEFTHRVTSGLAWLWSGWLVVQTRRCFRAGHPARVGAGLGLFFVTTEALIGAGLVLFEMVATNPSTARAGWVGAHLGNTFLLLGAQTLTAWWTRGGDPIRFQPRARAHWVSLASLVVVLVVAGFGAVIALGDSLLPAGHIDPSHLFVRLRLWHPTLAIAGGGMVAFAVSCVAFSGASIRGARFPAVVVLVLYLVQLGVGWVNVWLAAPVAMQLIHLALADAVWIALVWFSAVVMAQPAGSALSIELDSTGLTREASFFRRQ